MNSTYLKSIAAGLVLSVSVITGVANAGLIDRGNGMIYDDVLDVTWLQNANLAGTLMNWSDSVAWADNLSHGGFDDWRLTKVYDEGNNGCVWSVTGGTDCGYNVNTSFTDGNGDTFFSELAYMFYENLGNVAYYDTNGISAQAGWDSLNSSFTDALTGDTVSFENLYRNVYWSGTEYAPSTDNAWHFNTYLGYQSPSSKDDGLYAWAVRDGDVVAQEVSEVPEPASIAIFALGLLGLTMRARQRS
jgi:hypothetical protein